MVKYCVVKGCPNLQKKNDELSKSMFRFPVSNPELLDKWLESLSERDPKLKWSEQSKICEDHFEEKFIKIFEIDSGKTRKNLVPDAYPTIFKEYPEKIRRKKSRREDPFEFNMSHLELSAHSNNCRFCLKVFTSDCVKVRIDEKIARRFRNITQMELRISDVYSQDICERCHENLRGFSYFRNELRTKQMKLYRIFENMEDEDQEVKQEDDSDCDNVQIKQEADTTMSDDENMHNFADLCGDPVMIVEPLKQTEGIKTEGFSLFDFPAWNADSDDPDDENNPMDFVEEFESKIRSSSMKREGKREKKRVKPIIKMEDAGLNEDGSRKKTVKKALCQECGKSFSPENFRRHYERVHLKVKRYSCDFCGYKCYLRYNMIDHLKTHTGEKSIKCTECDKFFSTDQGLRAHKKNCHSDERPFACDCGKAFKTKCSLVIHIRYNHTKEKPFVCDICDKQFYTKYKLKNHRITHSDNPQVPCDVCGKLFHTRSQLGRHQLTHQEPRFTCELCGKKFIKKCNYKTHLKTHSGQRDFGCPYCDMKYFKNAHLNRHILNLHMKLKVKCEVPGCTSQFARKETYRNHVLSHHKNLSPDTTKIILDRIKEIKFQVENNDGNQYQLNVLSQPMY